MQPFSFNKRNAAFILLLFMLGLLLAGMMIPALAAPSMQDDDAGPATTEDDNGDLLVGADNSDLSCGECHLDYHSKWNEGVHAIAYDRETFQEAWANTDNDPTCLGCHTTNFVPATNEYSDINIQCEACHGENEANHPPEPIVVETEAEMCGDCHTQTFDEWEHSLHSFTENMGAIGCSTCHNPHGQILRFETVDGLCLNCHKNNPDNKHEYAETFIHVVHNESEIDEVEVSCASCHMYNSAMDELHELPNHTMDVETRPCTDCHEYVAELGLSEVLVDVDTELAMERDELQARVEELETELEAAEEETQEAFGFSYVQLTQGLIIGLGLGITVFLVFRRRGELNGVS